MGICSVRAWEAKKIPSKERRSLTRPVGSDLPGLAATHVICSARAPKTKDGTEVPTQMRQSNKPNGLGFYGFFQVHGGATRAEYRNHSTKENRGIESFSIPPSVVARGRNHTWTTGITVPLEVRVA